MADGRWAINSDPLVRTYHRDGGPNRDVRTEFPPSPIRHPPSGFTRPLRRGSHHFRDRCDATHGEAIRRHIRWNSLLPRDLEDAECGVEDLVRFPECAVTRPPGDFAVHVDHTTGVGDVIRCVQDSDRKSTRLNSSHGYISYAVFCLK